MATIRRFSCDDLLRFASVNLDHLTDTASVFSYLTWLAKWSDLCIVAVAPGNQIIGYILGAVEEQSDGKHWESLVIDVNVASQYRRQGLATKLMQLLEKRLVNLMLVSPRDLQYSVCLFVDVDNGPAKKLFEQRGYEVNRSMSDFISDDEEDTLYMAKELSEDEDEDLLQMSLLTKLLCGESVHMGRRSKMS